MTWNETHERIRIIREVEAAAAADMSGAVPWREEWRPYFDGPVALVAALRSRWQHMCEAQLDVDAGEDAVDDTYARLRRTQAGVLLILRRYAAGTPGAPAVLTLAGPRLSTSLPSRARRLHFRGGPTLPA
ncbi:hypothetical protein FHP29_15270 [Nocardioides albidus]|uniref:Uncharacterized protein n=1 Tax=Nocardioides albidus TaxID=1517589 RepID=A0A5C4VS11_9ACTN|nr:hypothetical protein [Nocardioides albidus]TNM38590.1 hypothetical protein FHP29_15270 [Nocardioides albidus]